MLGSDSLPPKLLPGAADTSAAAVTADRLLLLPPGESVCVTIRFDPPVSAAQCEGSAPAAAGPAAGVEPGTPLGNSTSRSSRSTAQPPTPRVQPQGSRSNSIIMTAPGTSHGVAAVPTTATAAADELGNTAGARATYGATAAGACGITEPYQGALVVSFTTGQQQVWFGLVHVLQALLQTPQSVLSLAAAERPSVTACCFRQPDYARAGGTTRCSMAALPLECMQGISMLTTAHIVQDELPGVNCRAQHWLVCPIP